MLNRTNLEHGLGAASVWLYEHGFELNNREWTTLIWLGIIAVWLLQQAKVRQCLSSVLRSAASPKLLMVWVSFILWILFFVVLARKEGLWEPRLTKDTLVWAGTAGVVSLASFTDAHQPGFFQSAVWRTIGVAAFMEYLVSLSAFPLLIEILLQPLIVVFATAPILVKGPDEQQRWQGWSNRFFILLGIALVGNTSVAMISAWDSIDLRLFVLRALWPIGLGLWVLVLVYLWALVSSYERAFLSLTRARPGSGGWWKIKVGLMLGLGLNLEWIHHAAKGGTYQIGCAQSVWTAIRAAKDFKRERLAEKKAEQTYQANLQRFAGQPGLDDQGRPLDKREFRETRKALDWLHVCQMGWFRREPVGYKRDLVERFGDDFTNHGLPIPSGIVMRVSDDGTKWYAWRQTVGGHHFAIGANGDPPNQWRYDGRKPPAGYPKEAPEWGDSPFNNAFATNWNE